MILFLELDDLMFCISLFGVAMIFGGMFWIVFFFLSWAYLKMKKKSPRGFFKHLIYMSGLTTLWGYPTSFEKRFVE